MGITLHAPNTLAVACLSAFITVYLQVSAICRTLCLSSDVGIMLHKCKLAEILRRDDVMWSRCGSIAWKRRCPAPAFSLWPDTRPLVPVCHKASVAGFRTALVSRRYHHLASSRWHEPSLTRPTPPLQRLSSTQWSQDGQAVQLVWHPGEQAAQHVYQRLCIVRWVSLKRQVASGVAYDW